MKVDTIFGEVHIDDVPGSPNKTVRVEGAINREHALSIASQAVTEVGLDGEWGAVVAKVTRTGPVYTLTLKPERDDWTLGPCGCVDYHYADCPLRTG